MKFDIVKCGTRYGVRKDANAYVAYNLLELYGFPHYPFNSMKEAIDAMKNYFDSSEEFVIETYNVDSSKELIKL
jgi:hypothetical protein